MSVAVSNRRQTGELAKIVARRIGDLIRPLADTSMPVPKSEWTVGETAAHLAFAKDLMARMVAGEALTYSDGTREGLAAANMESLGGLTERNGAVLAGMIESGVDAFFRTADLLPSGSRRNSPLGPLPVDVYSSYVLAHLMMHGEPMSRALRKKPVMDRESVLAAMPFVIFAMERFVDSNAVQNLTAAFALHVRGGQTYYITFDKGQPRFTSEKVRRVDCHVSADPVALLKVGFRIIEQWGPIATFKLTTWGPKPWLAFRFAGLFLPP
ncbi:MAG TPA: sterol-binding protein [Actinomycetota bacterium]|nr:sterol-binding protein [Actinomycetota bacterium]